jgi:hypothetical protein
MTPNSNILPLPFYDSLSKQQAAKWYAYGQAYEYPVPAGFILPFQIMRSRTGAAITSASIVRVADGNSTDILAQLQNTGLEVAQPTSEDFDLVVYPGTIEITYSEYGYHYLVLSDGTNTWYSDYFCSVASTDDLIRISYWHLEEEFCVPGGFVRYQAPYKSTLYLCTDIGKPSYEYDEEVAQRDGRSLKLKQTSFKRYRFNVILPEFLTDAMRLISLHDEVEIYNYRDGRTYSVDEFDMNDPAWEQFGDLADVTFEFTTDTVVINSGRPVGTTAYEVEPGNCIVTTYDAVAQLTLNDKNYSNAAYLDSSGIIRNLQEDDYIVVLNASLELILQQYNGSSYNTVTLTDGDIVYNAADDEYLIADSGELLLPRILTYDDGTDTITARALPNVQTKLYAVTNSGDTLLGTHTQAELAAGVVYELPAGTDYLYIEAQSANCGAFAKSSLFRVGGTPAEEGVGFWIIETDFVVQ